MDVEPRVRLLLEELLDSERTPEEVCRDFPELLPQVRRRWGRKLACDARLDAMFPAPVPDAPFGDPSSDPPSIELPEIPGHELFGVLGRGGMGIVYEARHVRLNRTVAVKMLVSGAHASPESRKRFLREAEAIAGLRHPNIVQAYEMGDRDGQPYFTMEFIEGGSLAQRLAGVPQPAHQASALVATLAAAVEIAHQSGIVHRDLKPANILLTAAGMPKIADFGLARRFDGEPSFTLSGVRVGTPSYMAPEQAMGNSSSLGPLVDIYALGAILYEMLTGRPPFRAETSAETERQVIAQEPVPPSRLNDKVPRDLETICLKCLQKPPDRRYSTAAALAEDLVRFQRGEPIAARPAGLRERSVKWARRRPTLTALIAGSSLMAMSLVGAAFWLITERASIVRAVENELNEAVRSQKRSAWGEAKSAIQRAKVRLGDRGPAQLRRSLDQADRDQRLVEQLDKLRVDRTIRVDGVRGYWEREYEKAFLGAGLGSVHDDPAVVARRIEASNIRRELVEALDVWALSAGLRDQGRVAWLLDVARRADPDPNGLRDRLRDPATRSDREQLAKLAESVRVTETPVTLLVALGEVLQRLGGNPVPFLERVQQQYPADYWANCLLATCLIPRDPAGSARYYQAALAIRPGTPVVYANLGLALSVGARHREAIFYFREAIRLDPNSSFGPIQLAWSLERNGQKPEALEVLQQAFGRHPDLKVLERWLKLTPMPPGELNERRLACRARLESPLSNYEDWEGYAELCLFLDREEDYRRCRMTLLDRFGTTSDPTIAEGVARTCLLLPPSDDELRKATALIERAMSRQQTESREMDPQLMFIKGLADHRQGRLESSISIMQGRASSSSGPASQLVLAMSQHRLGRKREALATLAAAILSIDWTASAANDHKKWIFHALRREAESVILPNLSEFVRGNYKPRSNDERLALLGLCQFKELHQTAASLYQEAFAADPKLADNPEMFHLYRAASYAALTGSGRGADGTSLHEAERMQWRKQARNWLDANLASWSRYALEGEPGRRQFVEKILAHWQSDSDLGGLRDPAELEKLSPSERQECHDLWRDVDALLERLKAFK